MKILLATDGSKHSEGAASFLTSLNLSAEDEVTIFHVVYWIPFLYDRESYFDTFKEIKMKIAPEIIDSAFEILKPLNAKISTAITDGSPEQSIIDTAVDSGTDLIVMGARGIKGIEAIFVGSTTKSVAANSPVPVFIIKLPVFHDPDRIKILFATDGSEYSLATEKLLSSIPFYDNTEMTVLNVIWSYFSDIPEKYVMKINERIKDDMAKTGSAELMESERIIEQTRKRLGKRFSNINILSKVGDPSAEILKTSEALGTDIIAVGCRGLRWIKGMLGSVSRNVITHSKCSVLIGKMCKE